MTENSYDGKVGGDNEPAILEARLALIVGPSDTSTILASRSVAGEVIASGPAAGLPQISISDTCDMLVEAVLALGEGITDQSGARYSESMPDFLEAFAHGLMSIDYDEADDKRQDEHRSQRGLKPLS